MRRFRKWLWLGVATLSLIPTAPTLAAPPVTTVQDFQEDPLDHGWVRFGEAELLRWTNSQLEVTWDSSKSNSYLQLPLQTILTREDDFRLALDLLLHDIAAGVATNKPGTLQLAFGFQNRADAERTNFFRGTGSDSPNLVEFNYFPDTGFGATVWPAILSTNSAINYTGASDFTIFELPLGVPMRISFAYAASNETATITIVTNGQIAATASTYLATNAVSFGQPFTNFKIDTFAISSYSDAGQTSEFAGSLLASGIIDNVVVTVPPPPVRDFRGGFERLVWETQFLSATNWQYRLETSTDLESWSAVTELVPGTGGEMALSHAPSDGAHHRFYRLYAHKPE